MEKKKVKVALGMSGGVDSSVAAKLLIEDGYEVVGFFMKLWHDPTCKIARSNACCDEKSLRDARKVAEMLGIKFYVVDAREKFKKYVVDYFIEEYKNLRTPNPCVVCNEKIKFGWLLDYAQKLGCEYLATGHYARIARDDKNFKLLKGRDENKDQTYFLYRLNQDQLSHILFPVGEHTKPEVREMAKKWDLPVHEKKESQEVCFVQEETYRDFLRRYLPENYFKSGEIVDSKGSVIGKHEGLINYTIGQRKGISQNAECKIQNRECRMEQRHQDRKPLYVTGFDLEKNQLVVGAEKDLVKGDAVLEQVTWIGRDAKSLEAKIRYRSETVPARLVVDGTSFVVKFQKPQRAVTPGQSIIFYDGDEVLGGGIITG